MILDDEVRAATFDRALVFGFVDALAAEATLGGWWADVLADDALFVGLRGRVLNVYWCGQSLFNVSYSRSRLTVTTHQKYLVDPKLASQVPLSNGHFGVEKFVEKTLIRDYKGNPTLRSMKKAAEMYSGLEKTGCHFIAINNPNVVDCEIAFPGRTAFYNGVTKLAPRVDLASIEPDGNTNARLVFWEAKHFDNPELRAAKDAPPVIYQIRGYEKYLSARSPEIVKSYQRLAKDLVRIGDMGAARSVSPLITDVASGQRNLSVEPKVGLIIFGFDSAQGHDTGWGQHLKKLKDSEITVKTAGNAKNIRLAP